MDFMNKVNELAKTAADKTTELAENAKLKAQILSDEKSIKELETKIGAIYYEKFAAGEEVAPEVQDLCTAISVHRDNIKEKKAILGVEETPPKSEEDLFV